MDIWSLDKIILFVAFVIPGFISLKTYLLIYPNQVYESSKMIVDAIAYSCINYGILFIPIYAVEHNKLSQISMYIYCGFYVFVILVAPVIWVLIWKVVREMDWVQCIIPHPTQKPWDFVFSKRKSYWIVATLKDGTKIGGKFSSDSFASSNPSLEQIYIQERWILNKAGGFVRKVNDTEGIIILSSELIAVELFKYLIDEDIHGKKERILK